MNESLFKKRAFEGAHPLVRPDFEVLLTLAGMRQVDSPTAKAAMALTPSEPAQSDCTTFLFAPEGPPGASSARANCADIASFYDLSALLADDGWPLARSEERINLGISAYFQSPAIEAVQEQ